MYINGYIIITKAGDKVVVYADILILVNFIVDYFLLAISARFLHKKPRLHRQLLAAFLGGLFSLYIFLPQSNFLFQTLIQIFMCIALALLEFGFGGFKAFFRSVAVLYIVNFAYSGAMIALWLAAKPAGMVINNSVVYFNVSPLFLIGFSVLGYFLVAFLRKVLQKSFSQSSACTVTVVCGKSSLTLCGIVDTGNNLTDAFGLSQIFVTEDCVVDALLKSEKLNVSRYRAIPCNTVTGECLLDGYRIDTAQVVFEKRKFCFKNPILAVSQTSLEECKIIVNPNDLN